MDRIDALRELIREVRAEKSSKAALKRLQKVCSVLGLNERETRYVEAALDYRNGVDGEIYAGYLS